MNTKITLEKKNNNFYKLVNNLFIKIEDNLDMYYNDIDIDYQIQDYIITITFENKSVIIINKQEALKQVWLATKKNGYHFNYKKNQWICNRTNKDFWEIFQTAFSIQANQKVIFSIK